MRTSFLARWFESAECWDLPPQKHTQLRSFEPQCHDEDSLKLSSSAGHYERFDHLFLGGCSLLKVGSQTCQQAEQEMTAPLCPHSDTSVPPDLVVKLYLRSACICSSTLLTRSILRSSCCSSMDHKVPALGSLMCNGNSCWRDCTHRHDDYCCCVSGDVSHLNSGHRAADIHRMQ